MIYKQEDICCKSYGYKLWKMSAYRLKYIYWWEVCKKADYHTYICVIYKRYMNERLTYIDDNIYIYVLLIKWIVNDAWKRCKVCTVDMNSARNIEFMCSMCCTCQWYEFVLFIPTLRIWCVSWTCKDATWN